MSVKKANIGKEYQKSLDELKMIIPKLFGKPDTKSFNKFMEIFNRKEELEEQWMVEMAKDFVPIAREALLRLQKSLGL